MVNIVIFANDENTMTNSRDYSFADMHRNLKVKMKPKTKMYAFVSSIQFINRTFQIIERSQYIDDREKELRIDIDLRNTYSD